TRLASRSAVLLPLPRQVRPFVVDLALTLWTVLELVYLAGLGDVSWLPAHPGVHLEPQARAAALVLMTGQPEVSDAGLMRWVFPVWRFSALADPSGRPDALDVARAIRTGGCLDAPEVPPEQRGKLGPTFEENAQAVWIVRHWSVDEMLEVWARCIAEDLARCGERLEPPRTVADVLHLWAHQSGNDPCDARRVSSHWSMGLGRLSRDLSGPPVTPRTLPGDCPGREPTRDR
ncbi:MAG TPA: hypothetical protein VFN91_05015, partial [Myxococcaceae bacterium]|nr:hypothetical protein [Myxococcaceae bacterium]